MSTATESSASTAEKTAGFREGLRTALWEIERAQMNGRTIADAKERIEKRLAKLESSV